MSKVSRSLHSQYIPMDYSKAFRIIRAALGYSQAQMANLLGVGPSQISLIESGKRRPSHELIANLAEVLKVPIPLITLLASTPRDLDRARQQTLEPLAVSLLNLLIRSSDKPAETLVLDQDQRG